MKTQPTSLFLYEEKMGWMRTSEMITCIHPSIWKSNIPENDAEATTSIGVFWRISRWLEKCPKEEVILINTV
jgi:hypothetical protein